MWKTIYLYLEGGEEPGPAFTNEEEARKWWTSENGREVGDIYTVDLSCKAGQGMDLEKAPNYLEKVRLELS